MRVEVVRHDPRWRRRFVRERRRLQELVGSNVVAVHHIGSTAIPTIWAKPIIDILLEVSSIERLDDPEPDMATLGYEGLGEYGLPGRRYFRKDNARGERTHHVHAFQQDNPEIVRHLAFRDYLLAHDDVARAYSELKQKLAAAHPENMQAYVDGKDGWIKDIERKALAWRDFGV